MDGSDSVKPRGSSSRFLTPGSKQANVVSFTMIPIPTYMSVQCLLTTFIAVDKVRLKPKQLWRKLGEAYYKKKVPQSLAVKINQ